MGLTAPDFATLDTFRASNQADFEWTSDPEYFTPGLFVDGPTPGLHAPSHLPTSGIDALAVGVPVSTAAVANAAGVADSFSRSDHQHANVLAAYTTGARPAANSVPAGTGIYNTDDNAPQYSNGTKWYDAVGNES
jgi:hypothetical protein